MNTSLLCPVHPDESPMRGALDAWGNARRAGVNEVAALASQEYVTFHVGRQECAIKMPAVLGVRRHVGSAADRRAPQEAGSAGRRKPHVALVDMQAKLGGARVASAYSVTILAQAAQRTVGLVVDAVWDVVRLSAQQIRPVHHCASLGHACWISGVATVGARQLLLLDAERLIGEADPCCDALAHGMQ
jgi:purine-binding chemotaxis protein CheW